MADLSTEEVPRKTSVSAKIRPQKSRGHRVEKQALRFSKRLLLKRSDRELVPLVKKVKVYNDVAEHNQQAKRGSRHRKRLNEPDSNSTKSLDKSQDSNPSSWLLQTTTADNPELAIELEEFPKPSTAKQKEIRRLARQRQLDEMKLKETAELRRNRFLNRQGLLRRPLYNQKHVSWASQDSLITVHRYSPSPST